MSWLGVRLVKHTLVALVLFGSTVLAPCLLLLRKKCGATCIVSALTLFTVGSASLLGAAVCRGLDRGSLSPRKWRLLVASVWIFNPVLLTILGLQLSRYEITWWRGMPLAVVLALLSGRTRLAASDPDWVQEGCPLSPALMLHWLFSRVIFIGVPMLLVSLQVDLCLPYNWMFPQTAMIGLLVCGGCVLISLKFCIMCHCLASQRLAQAMVLVLLLASDWISSLHLMDLVSDDAKDSLLLYLLLVAGLVQLRSALYRLGLRSRWARAWMVRRTRLMGGELSSSMNLESSDSDNEQGPGSLPESFHEALVALLGFNVRQQNSSRQFLCGVRLAVPQHQQMQPQPPTEAHAAEVEAQSADTPGPVPPEGAAPAAPAAGAAAAPLPLEISSEHEKCVVCMEEFQPGDRVRPLPKCAHIFHASCLEQWILTQNSREATKCPMCRRPALARRQDKGCTKISELQVETTTGSARGSRDSANHGRRARERLQENGPGRQPRTRRPPGRRPNRSQQVTALRMTLGVSELLAQVAFDLTGTGSAAANLILEHRSILESDYGRGRMRLTPSIGPLEDAVPDIVAASPSLAGVEEQLRRQLRQLCSEHAHLATPWTQLTAMRQEEVLREMLQDVLRRLEARDGS